MAFSTDGRGVATATDDGAVQLWDVRTGKALAPPLRHKSDSSTYQIVFSPVGATVATASSDDTVGLWDARTGAPIVPPLQHEESVVAVAFSPDGRTVATAAADNAVRLWDARTGKSLTPSLRHQNTAYIVTFSPDGGILATGSDDEVGLWDARSGRPLVSPWRIQGIIKTIGFRPGGRDFFVATDHWLNTYSWVGEKIAHKNSQWLGGSWKQWFRFPSGCGNCLQVALGYSASSFHIQTLHFDEPTDPPIEGDPKELLKKWQARLGLKFDEQMRPVPR